MRHLVGESFVPATHGPSVSYWRLSDFFHFSVSVACCILMQKPHCSVMMFGNINKPNFFFVFFQNKITSWIFDGTFRNNSPLFFFEILISKQIALASLFSFPLRIKTSFRKNITDDSVFFFMEVECIGNIQIIHMEETGITQRTIGLMS